jgi:hypothetical protein
VRGTAALLLSHFPVVTPNQSALRLFIETFERMLEEAMRIIATSALVGFACTFVIGPAFATDAGGDSTKNAGAASGVILSKDGAVPEPGVPALALSPEKKQIVMDAIMRLDTHQATPNEFTPAPGADIPRAVNIHALPQTVLNAVPTLKGYMYAHLDREIVIVDALGQKAAVVIPLPKDRWAGEVPGTHEAALNAIGGLAGYSDEQLRVIYQGVNEAVSEATSEAAPSLGQTTGQNTTRNDIHVQPVPNGDALIAGSNVPAKMMLTPMPPNIAGRIPQLQGLGFAKLQDGRLLLADLQARKVVGVITQEEGTGATAGHETEKGSRDPLRHLEDSGSGSAYTGPHSIR